MKKVNLITKSWFFDIKDGELVEIAVIEFVNNLKNYIKSLILERVDPQDMYDDYNVSMIRSGVAEEVNFDDINLDQAIHIAIHLGLDPEEILSNPEHFSLVGDNGQTYMFNLAIFDNYNETILHSLAIIISQAFDLGVSGFVHVYIPEWILSDIASSVLEICNDPKYGPNLSIIDIEHPRRAEIDSLYH